MTKLSTDPYKGVRDFYPEDQAVQNYIFSVWRKVVESYGYEEYNASILEPAELYRSKTSDEIVNEQTYTFTDRGDREVTLRPEMTPTVARMIAGRRRDLAFPVRWYSIQNFFRYERPQRGRVREFWQLNADIFGVEGIEADIEAIALAYDIMKAFGAQDADFEIRINNRGFLKHALMKYHGMTEESAEAELSKMDKGTSSIDISLPDADPGIKELLEALEKRGISNARFDSKLIRGFSYYTGTVFEIFDTDPQNSRSIFGGGRYDRLLELFTDEKIPAMGFAIGDVTMRDFLGTHGLLGDLRSPTDVMICLVDEKVQESSEILAKGLRAEGVNVAVYQGNKKLGEQIAIADKKKIPFVIAVGERETVSGVYTLKKLASGEETEGSVREIAAVLRASASRHQSSAL